MSPKDTHRKASRPVDTTVIGQEIGSHGATSGMEVRKGPVGQGRAVFYFVSYHRLLGTRNFRLSVKRKRLLAWVGLR